MQIILKFINDIIIRETKRQEQNILSELRLTEAIIRSDLNEINSKVDKLQKTRKASKA